MAEEERDELKGQLDEMTAQMKKGASLNPPPLRLKPPPILFFGGGQAKSYCG